MVPPVPLIDFQNVTVQRGERVVLDGVTLSIAQGEHVAILGPNGSGKSTLIKVISRELYPRLKPEPWSLRILGRDRWRLFDLRNHLGLVSNDWMQMCTRDYSGYEIVLSGFFGSVGIWPNHEVTPEMERKAREVMELLEISHLAGRNTNEMSSRRGAPHPDRPGAGPRSAGAGARRAHHQPRPARHPRAARDSAQAGGATASASSW